MQLTIFNGSPRHKNSNTAILLNHFIAGYKLNKQNTVNEVYIKTTSKEMLVNSFINSNEILLAFPLYTDAMPGIVMEFFESLAKHKEEIRDKNLSFIIQCGFPESIHMLTIEKYLKKLTSKLNCNYLGTIIKGGLEGLQAKPYRLNSKLFNQFFLLGESLGLTGAYDKEIIEELRKLNQFSNTSLQALNILNKVKVFDIYWNQKLKHNNAFNERFNKPYAGS